MTFNFMQEIRRPVSVVLAVLALVGWGLSLFIETSSSAKKERLRTHIAVLQAQHDRMRAELEANRLEVLALAQIEAKLSGAADRLTVAIDRGVIAEKTEQLAAMDHRIKEARRDEESVLRQLTLHTERLAGVNRELAEADARLSERRRAETAAKPEAPAQGSGQ